MVELSYILKGTTVTHMQWWKFLQLAAATMSARKYLSLSFSQIFWKISNTASTHGEAFPSVEIMIWLFLPHLDFYFHQMKHERGTFEMSTLLPLFIEPCRLAPKLLGEEVRPTSFELKLKTATEAIYADRKTK